MKKYFLHDGTNQQGPFDLEELAAKQITADTPVWYDGLPDWTTAGKLEELKDIIVHVPPPFHVMEQVAAKETKPADEHSNLSNTETSHEQAQTISSGSKQETPVSSTPGQSVTQQEVKPVAPVQSIPVAKPLPKNTSRISLVAGLVLIAGTGFYVYWDMTHKKDNTVINTNTLNNQVLPDLNSTVNQLDSVINQFKNQFNPNNIDTSVLNMFTNDSTQNQ